MDGGRVEALASYRESAGLALGLDYMLTRFVPLLRKSDITDAQITDILENNPADIFGIEV